MMLKYEVMLIIVIFVILHSTPTLSLRTKLFLSGYFSESINSQFTFVERGNKSNQLLYEVFPAPVEKTTNSELITYQTEKKAFLYFATYYGEV